MDAAYYKKYYHFEREHWWFKARLKILEAFTKKIANNKTLKILNVGVATGATSLMLQQFGEVESIEYDAQCAAFTRQATGLKIITASATDLPFADASFDLVCAFDVVEHIEDDALAMTEMMRVCKQNGCVFITVPANMFLWSEHDEVNHHCRRYTAKTFKKIIPANSSIVKKTYFNSILFLPVSTIRICKKMFGKKKKDTPLKSDFESLNSPFINKLFYRIFKMELPIIKKFSVPLGISYLCILRKNN